MCPQYRRHGWFRPKQSIVTKKKIEHRLRNLLCSRNLLFYSLGITSTIYMPKKCRNTRNVNIQSARGQKLATCGQHIFPEQRILEQKQVKQRWHHGWPGKQKTATASCRALLVGPWWTHRCNIAMKNTTHFPTSWNTSWMILGGSFRLVSGL